MKNKSKGFFITFEGPEGSGKDSASRFVIDYLTKKGLNTIVTREPGGSEIGTKIRKILVDPANKKMDSLTELLLFIANRNQNIEEIVRPALKKRKIIVSNRHLDSSVAFQGAARKIDLALVNKLNKIAVKDILPDLTIILDVDAKVGLNRVFNQDRAESKKGQGDRIEQESINFHSRVRKEYLKMAKKSKRFVVIDTTKLTIPEVNDKLAAIIDKKLKYLQTKGVL